MPKRIPTRDAHRAIAQRQDFETHGSLSGHTADRQSYFSKGILPRDRHAGLDAQAEQIDFIVYSYGTPIAWHLIGGEWIVPAVNYSATSGRHQSQVRYALSNLGQRPITSR
jgi:hypothetical protein